MEPHLGFAHHEEEVPVVHRPFHLGLASFLSDPCQCGDGIGIDDPGQVVFLDIGESEHESKELTDIIRALFERSSVEDLGAGISDYPSKLHDAGIAATSRINGQGRKYG